MNTCNNDSKISFFTTLVHEDCFMADISIRLRYNVISCMVLK